MVRRRCGIKRATTIELGFVALFVSVAALPAQSPQASASAAPAVVSTRPCSTNPVLPASNAKKAARKLKDVSPPDSPPSCIEVQGQPIEIQEFLQNTARRQGWRIGEDRASEDTWFYVRYLDAGELDKYATIKVLIEPVIFSNGKAAVTIRTADLGDGFARVQITSHFQGEGKSADRASPQPASTWPLTSKGVLEQELVNALQTSFKPLE